MADVAQIRRCLQAFDFETLFIEVLGWDRHRAHLEVKLDDATFSLDAVAEKRGFQVFLCRIPEGQAFPSSAACNRIQRQVAKTAHENLIVFVDEEQSKQNWKWGKREKGRLLRSRGADYHRGQSGEALAQRLSLLAIELEEEEQEGFSLVDVTQRVRAAFDVDRVTRQFYGRFRDEHQAFLGFIKGITATGDKEWYASLMLNRLMFVYFIQKKGFLDGDLDYLQNRLQQTKELKGKDRFHSFYRYFLLRLFHEGFGQRETERSAELEALIGTVPYLNGGLFDVHELEHDNPNIQIADAAFEHLFAFFDQYQWHLDDRPLRNDTEINPDVLGYIFEKYINQKQMGAYYTKEDITDYIAKNTIIPYLFDAAAKRCLVGLQTGAAAWQLLADDPDRYIYDAVGHGIFVNIHTGARLEEPVPLPPEIEAGVADVSKREGWNSPAPAELALPTETWREHIARRQRCLDLREKLAAGEVASINDLVTLNLDILQFAQDVIDNCEGPDLLRAMYYTIAGRLPQRSNEHFQRGISVLDPTCGSGAFLFAALNILQPLYEACLDRMAGFIEESEYAARATPEEELDDLISQGESRMLEFKSSARWDMKQGKANKDLEKVIVKTVAALLNSDGGELVIGIDDAGEVVGLEHDYKLMAKQGHRDGYENWLTTLLFQNNFGKQAAPFVSITFAQKDGKDICRISAQPSPSAVYVKEDNNEQLYIRAGNSTRLLTAKEAIEYHKHRFDGEAPWAAAKAASAGKGTKAPRRFNDFRSLLATVDDHPSRTYFILKSIIINNLFGVDIMAEAVEICKLRLFLRLVSTVERADQLEPLPDIDFNIRAGNTLVGFATISDVRGSVNRRHSNTETVRILDGFEEHEAVVRILEAIEIVDRQFQMFRRQQMELAGNIASEDKIALRESLESLTAELNEYLARENGVNPKQARAYAKWKASHQPFHWLAEFFGIISAGGFDVIIGNPPYVEVPTDLTRSLLTSAFRTALERWSRDEDLYTFVVERSWQLLRSDIGRFGMILPLSIAFSTKRPFEVLRQTIIDSNARYWLSHFDRIPSALFGNDVRTRCTIAIRSNDNSNQANPGTELWTTSLRRWPTEYRDYLFTNLTNARVTKLDAVGFPKVGSQVQGSVLDELIEIGKSLSVDLTDGLAFSTLEGMAPNFPNHCVFVGGTAYNWFPAWREIPETTKAGGSPSLPARTAGYRFRNDDDADIVFALLCSSLGYWWWAIASDGFNLKKWLLQRFPIGFSQLDSSGRRSLAELGKRLRSELKKHYVYKDNRGRIGNFYLPACEEQIRAIDEALSRHIECLTPDFFADVREFNSMFSRASTEIDD